MELNVEAKRIMAVSISKLYASRAQRGGLRLHRSLLLSMVMRSARDIYHSACLAREREEQNAALTATEEAMDTSSNQAEVQESEAPMTPTPEPEPQPKPTQGACKTGLLSSNETREDKENHSPVSPDRHSRKRRGKASVAPDFLPSKRARLELGEERHATPGGALRTGLGYCCRARDTLTTMTMNRAIAAF